MKKLLPLLLLVLLAGCSNSPQVPVYDPPKTILTGESPIPIVGEPETLDQDDGAINENTEENIEEVEYTEELEDSTEYDFNMKVKCHEYDQEFFNQTKKEYTNLMESIIGYSVFYSPKKNTCIGAANIMRVKVIEWGDDFEKTVYKYKYIIKDILTNEKIIDTDSQTSEFGIWIAKEELDSSGESINENQEKKLEYDRVIEELKSK